MCCVFAALHCRESHCLWKLLSSGHCHWQTSVILKLQVVQMHTFEDLFGNAPPYINSTKNRKRTENALVNAGNPGVGSPINNVCR